jgi:hypothetical protein
MALSIGFRDSVSLLLTIQATGVLTFTLVGLLPTEHASLGWTHLHAGLSRRTPSGRLIRPIDLSSSGSATQPSPIVFSEGSARFNAIMNRIGFCANSPGGKTMRRYHHIGIPTAESKPGETHLKHLKLFVVSQMDALRSGRGGSRSRPESGARRV